MRNYVIGAIVLAMSGGCAVMDAPGEADLVIVNARVWTGTGRDADAVAVRGDRIAAVGSDAELRGWIDDGTQVIDAGGKRVVPGITDSHLHLVSGGLQLGRLHLRDVESKGEFVEAVRRVADQTPTGGWVLGGRWSVESWDDPSPPTKDWVDPVTGDKPLFLTRMDGHQALANSAALRLAGIDRAGPPDPEGGVIERDPATDEPTGILKDAAMDLVSRHIPSPSDEELDRALSRAMLHLNSFGITSVHEVSGPGDLAVLARAHRAGQLTVRVRKFVHVSDWRDAIESVNNFEIDDDWLTVAGFKGYMDGSLGSRTAYMYRPYADASPGDDYPSGILMDQADPPKEFRHMIEVADAAGLQCVVHAIGDEANHILLDAFAAVSRKNGPRDRRHRIEHAQHLLPEDIPRFGQLGVVASMQPFHKADDGRYAEVALGYERLKGSYAFRSLLDTGALVCFGSDWPLVTCNPWKGIATAVTAKTLDGKIWIPEESISAEEALKCYTVRAARSGFREDDLGTIEPGKLADLVILSQDVLNVPPERIAETTARTTIVGGEIVYEKN